MLLLKGGRLHRRSIMSLIIVINSMRSQCLFDFPESFTVIGFILTELHCITICLKGALEVFSSVVLKHILSTDCKTLERSTDRY